MITISTKDLPEHATMAHVAAASGAFPSVSQARKNGWDGPITLGVHKITKRLTVEVVDREVSEADERPRDKGFRPDLEPGFWPNLPITEDGSLAWAIQFPISDPKWIDRVIGAYAHEDRKRRKVVDIISTT